MASRPPDAAIVVVGSVNVDLIVKVARLPQPGETVIGGTFQRAPGGKGANQAVAAARLGARTWIVGLTGHDDLGGQARRDLENAGVDISRLGTGTSHTGTAVILVDDRGENLIAVASGANWELTGSVVHDALIWLDASEAIVLSNLEIPDEAVIAAAQIARERGWRFVLNPAPARALSGELLELCEVLAPNESELIALRGSSVEELLHQGPRAVVVTRGSRGADLYRPGRPLHHQPPFRVNVVDTTGAGDAFCAALAWGLASQFDLEQAVRLASAAGALACRAIGARSSLPESGELEDFVRA